MPTRDQSIDDCIYRDESRPSPTYKVTYEGFTLDNQDCPPDRPECLCRKSHCDGATRYWIKSNTNDSMFVNPYAHDFQPEHLVAKAKHKGEDLFNFTEVTQAQFEHYQNFLKTRNAYHLKFAERS